MLRQKKKTALYLLSQNGKEISSKDWELFWKKYNQQREDLKYTINNKAFDEYIADKSKSSIQAYKSAFKVCEELHDLEFKDIRTIQLQHVIDHSGKNYPTLKKIKVLFNVMYKYAMRYELCPKDNSRYVDILKYSK